MKNFESYVILIFFVSFTIYFASCDNQDFITGEQNSTMRLGGLELDELKKQYSEMLASSEHITYHNAILNFVDKMNGATIDPEICQTREKFQQWISVNIGKTDFVEASQALSQFDELKNLAEVRYLAYQALFDTLKKQAIEDIMEIATLLYPSPVLEEVQSDHDNWCCDQAGKYYDKILRNYAMIAAAGDGTNNENFFNNTADMYFTSAMQNLSIWLTDCLAAA